MVNFKENYTSFFKVPEGVQHFQWGGGVQLFAGWGVPLAYSYRKYITCDFPGEVWIPCPPPLDPHLGLSMVLSIHAENAPNLTNRYLGMFLEGQVDRQTDRQTSAQTADAKTISLRLHRGETSTEHRIFSVMFKNTTQCFR